MTYIITQPCVGVKDAACVEVCPVEAIFPDDDIPEGQEKYLEINAAFFQD